MDRTDGVDSAMLLQCIINHHLRISHHNHTQYMQQLHKRMVCNKINVLFIEGNHARVCITRERYFCFLQFYSISIIYIYDIQSMSPSSGTGMSPSYPHSEPSPDPMGNYSSGPIISSRITPRPPSNSPPLTPNTLICTNKGRFVFVLILFLFFFNFHLIKINQFFFSIDILYI